MIAIPSGVKVWLAAGHVDMRKGFPGLSLLVQEALKHDPVSGHLFVFRGRRGDLIKVIWHDGQGACLFVTRLERAASYGLAGGWNGDDLDTSKNRPFQAREIGLVMCCGPHGTDARKSMRLGFYRTPVRGPDSAFAVMRAHLSLRARRSA